MTDDPPFELDLRRSKEGKRAADIRRQEIAEFEAAQATLRSRQKELETQLFADPSANWREAAEKAQYLIRRYGETAEASDAKRQELIRRTLGDLTRLAESEVEEP